MVKFNDHVIIYDALQKQISSREDDDDEEEEKKTRDENFTRAELFLDNGDAESIEEVSHIFFFFGLNDI